MPEDGEAHRYRQQDKAEEDPYGCQRLFHEHILGLYKRFIMYDKV